MIVELDYKYINYLVKNIDYKDRRKLKSFDIDFKNWLLFHVKQKDMFVYLVNENPIAVFGCTADPKNKEFGIMSLVCMKLLKKHPFTFLKNAKKFVDEQKKKYKILYNYVDSRYCNGKKWLEFCGAKFNDVTFNSKDGVKFEMYTIEGVLNGNR